MLNKVGVLGGLFGGDRIDHPLGDPREVRTVLAALPGDNAFKALDEINGWLESLQAATDFPPDRLFEVLKQLDEAARPHIRRLTHHYLLTPRLSRNEEKRMWDLAQALWSGLAAGYERCLARAGEKGRSAEALRPSLALLAIRLIAALGALVKWKQYRYGPPVPGVWERLGRALLAAEEAGVAMRMLQAYPNQPGMTSPSQEYLKVAIFQAASLDSLLPLEVELAERLVAHFLPGFVFGPEPGPGSVYWIDLAGMQPPTRLARLPERQAPTLRFFRPGSAHAEMDRLLHELESGNDLPGAIDLGARYPTRSVLPVLRHLCAYLAPIPPQRRHDRHRVRHSMVVVPWLAQASVVFSGQFKERPAGLRIETWGVENVSRGGFGARVRDGESDWLKVGILLAMQPEGGDNWLLGIVRRYRREADGEARLGIQTLARQALLVELKSRNASGFAATAGIPALWLQDGNEPGEIRLVLPPASFDLGESLELDSRGGRVELDPVALVERTSDYDVGRFRARPPA